MTVTPVQSTKKSARFSGLSGVILSVSLLFGLIYGWLMLDFLEQAFFLATEGQVVGATVTAMDTDRVAASYKVDIVTYDRRFPTDEPLILGDPVSVTYLPSDPSVATIDPAALTRTAAMMAAVIVVSVLAGLAGLWRLTRH